ncbi:hypothetical protein CK203_050967 [Vitis vinifera]|uniref:Uncharacterized protein n=1 Tax=Vitis vinifera TaxID=29760 RepID=A0A438H3H9_VITVI|nr:hypothetical protein CK203_050967 [Vitis vinifera]
MVHNMGSKPTKAGCNAMAPYCNQKGLGMSWGVAAATTSTNMVGCNAMAPYCNQKGLGMSWGVAAATTSTNMCPQEGGVAVIPFGSDTPYKIWVLEPKGFNGNKNAKELENFLWDMEQFFKVAHISDAERVSITSIYLIGDAKPCGARVEDDVESGRP